MDLTKIEKPFGLLDEETQAALEKAYTSGEFIEFLAPSGIWETISPPSWGYSMVYRVRPTPKPPAIELPWDVIGPQWKWAAMDKDGEVWVYTHGPEAEGNRFWMPKGDGLNITDLFTGLRINVTDWRESLTKRPK